MAISTHTVADAQSHLLSLIERALAGESVVIERDGQPAVGCRSGLHAAVGPEPAHARRTEHRHRTSPVGDIGEFDDKMAVNARMLGVPVG